MTETAATGKVLNILLVEDDAFDVLKVKRGLQAEAIRHRLWTATDGQHALRILRGAPGVVAIPQPCVVVLDLDLPGMDGLSFLEELRQDPALKRTVVFVLTGSSLSQDKVNSYNFNIAGYILKSRADDGLRASLSALVAYCRAVELP